VQGIARHGWTFRLPAASVGMVGWVGPRRTGGSMRVVSSRVATIVMVVVGVAALAVAGRLLPTTPSVQRPATPTSAGVPAGTVRILPLQDVPTSTVATVEVPDVFGQTLARAKVVMRAAGLQGAAEDRDPQTPGAVVVVVQEPAAGNRVPRNSVVGFRTRTDVQANGVVRRLRLGAGQTTTKYLVVAPDPPTHPLTVMVTMPRAAQATVWLETEFKSRVPVVGGRQDPTRCKPTGGQVRCVVRFGVVNAGGELGIWTAKVAKHSWPPAVIEVTVKFAPR
jgi:PASTA domain